MVMNFKGSWGTQEKLEMKGIGINSVNSVPVYSWLAFMKPILWIPKPHKPKIMVYACNYSPWRVQAGALGLKNHSHWHSELNGHPSLNTLRPCHKRRQRGEKEREGGRERTKPKKREKKEEPVSKNNISS